MPTDVGSTMLKREQWNAKYFAEHAAVFLDLAVQIEQTGKSIAGHTAESALALAEYHQRKCCESTEMVLFLEQLALQA